jgi:hypothetical protein
MGPRRENLAAPARPRTLVDGAARSPVGLDGLDTIGMPVRAAERPLGPAPLSQTRPRVRRRSVKPVQRPPVEPRPRFSIQRRRNGRWHVLVEAVDRHGVALGRCERHGGVSSAVERLARFIPCGDGLRVSDLGGGVFRRIRVPTLIDDGGRMRIGRHTLIFRAGRLLDPTTSGGPPPCIELLTVEVEPGPRFPLLGPVTVVGRKAAYAEIALVEDSLISARHLRLQLAGQQVLAEDLQSRNGSYVQIFGDSTIRPGEVILVGPYRLRASLLNGPTR